MDPIYITGLRNMSYSPRKYVVNLYLSHVALINRGIHIYFDNGMFIFSETICNHDVRNIYV